MIWIALAIVFLTVCVTVTSIHIAREVRLLTFEARTIAGMVEHCDYELEEIKQAIKESKP